MKGAAHNFSKQKNHFGEEMFCSSKPFRAYGASVRPSVFNSPAFLSLDGPFSKEEYTLHIFSLNYFLSL